MCFPGGTGGKESACNARNQSLTLGLGRSSGGGHGNPLQYPCLENSMNRRTWWATVHGVTKRHDYATNTHTHFGDCPHTSPHHHHTHTYASPGTQARSLGVIKFPFPSAPTFTLILLTRKVFNSSMWPQPCSSSGHSCLWFPTTASLQVPCLPSHPHQMYHAHCTDRVIIPKNAEPTALQQTL